MADILYNVMARPIANEPSQKDAYHVDRAQKDARAKKIDDDEPRKQNSDQQSDREQNDQTEHTKSEILEQRLNKEKRGKGLYKDEEGKEHLDFYA